MTQADAREQFLRARARRRRLTPGDAQRHHHVLERGELAQQVMELEHESDGAIANGRELVVASGSRASARRSTTSPRSGDPARQGRAAACSSPRRWRQRLQSSPRGQQTGSRRSARKRHRRLRRETSSQGRALQDTHRALLPAARNVTHERVTGHETLLMRAGGGSVSSLMANRLQRDRAAPPAAPDTASRARRSAMLASDR